MAEMHVSSESVRLGCTVFCTAGMHGVLHGWDAWCSVRLGCMVFCTAEMHTYNTPSLVLQSFTSQFPDIIRAWCFLCTCGSCATCKSQWLLHLKLRVSQKPITQRFNTQLMELIFSQSLPPHYVGTRFRPLSFQVPKPLFPIAGFPMVQHQIEACAKLPDCKEVLLLGYFQPSQELKKFLQTVQKDCNLSVR